MPDRGVFNMAICQYAIRIVQYQRGSVVYCHIDICIMRHAHVEWCALSTLRQGLVMLGCACVTLSRCGAMT